MSRYDVVVLGGGFAGSVLGRCMAAEGARVLLLERAEHPRFALGESTTPLANFALERLAARYGFEDLHTLAAWGRWARNLPHLGRGLKRGFTFYDHRPGEPWRAEAKNGNRALFAASPDDDIADSHWLRADVDLHLLRAAEEAGAEVLEGADVTDLEVGGKGGGSPGRGVDVAWSRHGARRRATADRVVDATGATGLVSRRLRLLGPPPLPFQTALVSAHVDGLPAFRDVAGGSEGPGAESLDAPYPEERAAIHHLLAEGWIYALPFDHGPVSVGAVLRTDRVDDEALLRDPREIFALLVGRYPTLAQQFRDAQVVEPWTLRQHGLAFRRTAASGDRWLLLPGAYAFYDPLFSTGIAWSLLGVERVRDVLCGEASSERYGRCLAREADQMGRLVEAAWLALDAPAATRFDDFMAVALCYFGAVSWSESVARMCHADGRPVGGTWDGFLGAGDEVLERLFADVLARLRNEEPRSTGSLRREVVERLEPRDVAGLDQPPSPNVFPLDLDVLVRRAGKLGLDREVARARLPRLRGQD